MPSLPLPRLPTAAVLCGAALLGSSLDGLASVDRALQAAPAQAPGRHEHLVSDRGAGRLARAGRRELWCASLVAGGHALSRRAGAASPPVLQHGDGGRLLLTSPRAGGLVAEVRLPLPRAVGGVRADLLSQRSACG